MASGSYLLNGFGSITPYDKDYMGVLWGPDFGVGEPKSAAECRG